MAMCGCQIASTKDAAASCLGGNILTKIGQVGSSFWIKVMAVIAVTVLPSFATSEATAAGSRAPLGFQIMCLRTPAECKGGGAASVDLSAELLTTLKRVNSHINRSITPRNDRGPDVWTADAIVGDCEDYVLAKRRALISAGVPSSSLRIAYVKTRSGEGHAILVVKTNSKDLVLDNLFASVRPLSQTDYRIVSMSGANPRSWI